MESIKRKIKEEDRYVLLYDESLNQQLKKTQLDIKTILELRKMVSHTDMSI
jgi:hypothetical protein